MRCGTSVAGQPEMGHKLSDIRGGTSDLGIIGKTSVVGPHS